MVQRYAASEIIGKQGYKASSVLFGEVCQLSFIMSSLLSNAAC